uniref:Uncharacterized protein n=1 Tax=Hyaloperonospora arabidopsidis (strain Emoy2) TaxID=559515 RepID=M4BBU0_HYAAE
MRRSCDASCAKVIRWPTTSLKIEPASWTSSISSSRSCCSVTEPLTSSNLQRTRRPSHWRRSSRC